VFFCYPKKNVVRRNRSCIPQGQCMQEEENGAWSEVELPPAPQIRTNSRPLLVVHTSISCTSNVHPSTEKFQPVTVKTHWTLRKGQWNPPNGIKFYEVPTRNLTANKKENDINYYKQNAYNFKIDYVIKITFINNICQISPASFPERNFTQLHVSNRSKLTNVKLHTSWWHNVF
jgi:hypothetical protein